MTKQDILDYFKDINFMYNNASMHDTLSSMLDELLENRPEIVPCSKCECRNKCMQEATLINESLTNFIDVKINYCSLGRKEKHEKD
jgi:hypothetical protein